MSCILLGTDKQTDFFFPRRAHASCLPAGGGALKTQGTWAELEKENQETVKLCKPREVSVSKERIIPCCKETKED